LKERTKKRSQKERFFILPGFPFQSQKNRIMTSFLAGSAADQDVFYLQDNGVLLYPIMDRGALFYFTCLPIL